MSLGVYKIRHERSSDGTVGDLKYHTSCWRNIILKRVKEYDVSPESSTSPVSVSTVETSLHETRMRPMYYLLILHLVSSNL